MKTVSCFLWLSLASTVRLVASYSVQGGLSNHASHRRAFLSQSVATVSSAFVVGGQPLVALGSEGEASSDSDDFITTESGLKYRTTKEGTGAIPETGQLVKAHYTGWLDGFDSPRKFDSSRDRNRPFTFNVGTGRVIRGWDECFSTMKVGERRQIIVPPRLGYGDRGAGGIIPPGATLYFDVELLGIL